MRGNPIKEWVIFSVLWLILMIPVVKLTGRKRQSESVPKPHHESTASQAVQATALFHYTGKPLFFKVSQYSKTLCDVKAPPSSETELEIPLTVEDESAELLLEAEWPDEQEHVFEIALIVAAKEEQKAHCWANRELNDVVSFEW